MSSQAPAKDNLEEILSSGPPCSGEYWNNSLTGLEQHRPCDHEATWRRTTEHCHRVTMLKCDECRMKYQRYDGWWCGECTTLVLDDTNGKWERI